MKNNHLIFLFSLALLSVHYSCSDDHSGSDHSDTDAGLQLTGNPAIDDLTRKIGQDPQNATLYAARAEAWYQNENYDEGISDLETAISLDSSQVLYYHVLADMYMDYYRSRLALNTMERAAVLFPDRIPTLLKLAEFQLILELHKDALFTLERIRAIDPQNAEMFFMFGNVFRDQGRKAEAMNAYQTAVENNPELIDAWFLLANLLAEKNPDLAIRYYDNALRIDSTHIEALKAKARFLANDLEDLAGAIAIYKKINTLDPQYEAAYYDAGLVYLDMDSLQQAWNSFDLAVKIEPLFTSAWYHRGVASELMGKSTDALNDYKNVLNLDPEFESAKAGVQRIQGKQ